MEQARNVEVPVTEPGFKPYDVNMRASYPPLVGTMGRIPAEVAAALIVRACQANGNVWQDVDLAMIGEVAAADIAAGHEPLTTMSKNPLLLLRPDFNDLVARGRAEWVGGLLRITPFGFDGLRKFVAPFAISLAELSDLAAVIDLAKAHVAGGDSPPLRADTTGRLARGVIALSARAAVDQADRAIFAAHRAVLIERVGDPMAGTTWGPVCDAIDRLLSR